MRKKLTPIVLTPAECAERTHLVERLDALRAKMQPLHDELAKKLAAYILVLDAARDFAHRVEERLDAAISERSDAWQNSINGEAASDLSWRWCSFTTGGVPTLFEMDHADKLAALPCKPE